MASGLLNTVRAVGNTVTLAAVAALLSTQIHARLDDRRLAGQVAAGDVADPTQIEPFAQSLQTTLLIVASACAVLGAAAMLTRPSKPTHAKQEGIAVSTHPGAETAVLRYTIKPDYLAEHLQLLGDVYAELASIQPPRFSWSTYQIAASRDFIEIATGNPLPGPLPSLPAFQRYRAGLDHRCETRHFDSVTVLGSFAST